MNWAQNLKEVYSWLEDKNKGLDETPEVVQALKDLDDLWDNLNSLDS